MARSKKLELVKIINKAFKIDFLIFKAKTAFLHLKMAFTEALILHYFDLKSYI